tara:strand:+ start:41 stop:4309 length:4269 start_codon:yes stop_codon:yes gene_type:complete
MAIFGKDITAEDLIAGNYQGTKKAPTQFGQALRYGLDQPTENTATTLGALGFDAQADTMRGLVDAPENYESAAAQFMNPEGEGLLDFNWRDLPLATVEQAGQLGGSIASRFIGAGIGSTVGPMGTIIGGLLGPGLFEAVQIAGPVALERARNRDPQGVEKEPTGEDWAGAMGTAVFSGALNAVGAFGIPGLNSAILGTTGKTITKTLGAGVREGITEGLQGVTEQVGSTALTDKGLTIEPKQAIGESLIGGTTGTGVQAPISVLQAINSMNNVVNPAVNKLNEEPGIIEGMEADVPVIEEFEDEVPISDEPIFDLPKNIKDIKSVLLDPDAYGKLPGGTRDHFGSSASYNLQMKELFEFVENDSFDETIDMLFADAGARQKYKKDPRANNYNDGLNATKKEQFEELRDDVTLPSFEYAKTPEYKEKVKQRAFELAAGLGENTQMYGTTVYPVVIVDTLNRYESDEPNLLSLELVSKAAKIVNKEHVQETYMQPYVFNKLKEIVEVGQQDREGISMRGDERYGLGIPQGTSEKMIEYFVEKAKETLLKSNFQDDSPFMVKFANDFFTSSLSGFQNGTENINEFLESLDDRTATSEGTSNVNDLLGTQLFQGNNSLASYFSDMELEEFATTQKQNNLFKKDFERLPDEYKEIEEKDLNRIEKMFYDEVFSHRDLYENQTETFGDGNTQQQRQGMLINLIENLRAAKSSVTASSLAKAVAERFTNQSNLKTFDSIPIENIDDDTIGPFTSYVPNREELEKGVDGPIDPNFLSTSAIRKQLSKLKEAGIVSLPANGLSEYLNKPYKELSTELKEIVPNVPKKQAGQEQVNAEKRKTEGRDFSIGPYLESRGNLEVKIDYIDKLIEDNLTRFKVFEVRDWKGENLVYAGGGTGISGPVLGRYEFATQFIPLLKPSDQSIVESGDVSAAAEVLDKSPEIYTERDAMHNWIEDNPGQIKGLGTVAWIRGSVRSFEIDGETEKGSLPEESQSYWIQKTRQAMAKVKKTNVMPTKIFRSDFQDALKEMKSKDNTDLDSLLFEKTFIEKEANQTLSSFLPSLDDIFYTVPEKKRSMYFSRADRIKNRPEGYFASFLNDPRTFEPIKKDFLESLDELFRLQNRPSYYVEYSSGSVDLLLNQDPTYGEKRQELNLKRQKIEDDYFVETVVEEQPYKRFGKELTEEFVREYSNKYRLESVMRTSEGVDLNAEDPSGQADVVKNELSKITADADQTAKDQTILEKKTLQREAARKGLSKSPELLEYVKLLESLPTEEEVVAYERAKQRGDSLIQPDPPFRNSFNQIALRIIIKQAMKDGLGWVLIPATVSKKDKKKIYSTTIQEEHGQSGAPMTNYINMLKEGERISQQYGLNMQTVDLNTGTNKTGQVTAINILPLYELIAEQGFLLGYKKGGLVTKAQGAGYNINLGDYGRSYK